MKLMVIDGNSIVNRAFYGVSQNLSTRDGLPTNAIFGFLNILFKLLDEEKPEGLAVAFDLKAPTFRHLAYEGYKAQRKGMPEELAAQMPVLKEVLDAMNIRRYELEGWEADDLLGTMARINGEGGGATVVVTGDKDSLQLIDGHTTVKLVTTRMGQTTTKNMTPDTFREQYGFDPIHIIDLKALMGDASDNIPGVKGVGEKTAMALIQQYASINVIYDRLPDIDAKPAAIRKLTEGEADARMSYDLAAIRRYLDELDTDLARVDTVVKTGNPMADAILNSKISLARARHIPVRADAHIPLALRISEIDLCVILGNLFDNAIEASLALPEEQRMIRVYMDIKGAQLYISFTNFTADKKRRKENGLFSSTKGAGHGLGLRRVDEVVRRMEGYISRNSEDGAFTTEVLLPGAAIHP